MTREFIRNKTHIIAVRHIVEVDISDVENLALSVVMVNGTKHRLVDLDAIEAMMVLCPAALEGKRLRWPKNVWGFHNVVAHPAMQVLAWAKQYKLAFRLHDATVPKPTGRKKKR